MGLNKHGMVKHITYQAAFGATLLVWFIICCAETFAVGHIFVHIMVADAWVQSAGVLHLAATVSCTSSDMD